MTNWREYWKEMIKKYVNESWCRDEEIGEDTKFFFMTECWMQGACFGNTGAWRWSDDFEKLTSYLSECVIRGTIASVQNQEINETLDLSVVEYVEKVLSGEDFKGYENRLKAYKSLLKVAREIECGLNEHSITEEKLERFLKRVERATKTHLWLCQEFNYKGNVESALRLVKKHDIIEINEEDLSDTFYEDVVF